MSESTTKPIALTQETFIRDVCDFTNATTFDYKGTLPAVIDFWAEWCGPCRAIAPIFEELAQEFQGKVQFYKVDTEAEQELASVFGIRSIPSFLFIPVGAPPTMASGAYPKDVFQEIIRRELLGEDIPESEDGFEEEASWGTITVEELRAWLSDAPTDEQPMLLDVRNQDEYAAGHLPNALLIPVDELESRLEEIEDSLHTPMVVYCRSGARSARACEMLARNGYTTVNLEGGMLAWSE